ERVRVKERVRAERQRYMLQSLVQRTVVGGYFELEFEDFDSAKARPDLGFGSFDGTSRFQSQRLILLTASDITDALSFATELEFENGTREIELEYAALDYKFFGRLNLRAGAVLIPLGRLNLLHDGPIRDLVTRPLVARRIIPSTYSDVGGGLFGNFSLGKSLGQEALQDFYINYELYLVNGLQGEDGGSLFITKGGGTRSARREGLIFEKDNNDNKALVGRVGFSPFLGLELGVSGYLGKYDQAGKNNLSIFALDAFYKKGPFEFRGEYARANISRDASIRALNLALAPRRQIPGSMEGFYLEVAYHLFPEALRSLAPTLLREATLTLIGRYGYISLDKDGAHSSDFIKRRTTLGLNFRPVEQTAFKFEFNFDSGQRLIEPTQGVAFSVTTYF
ncbi:MAG: hypothetical protein V3S39_03725, partial [Thermodesulfobacteriota bacterium]